MLEVGDSKSQFYYRPSKRQSPCRLVQSHSMSQDVPRTHQAGVLNLSFFPVTNLIVIICLPYCMCMAKSMSQFKDQNDCIDRSQK